MTDDNDHKQPKAGTVLVRNSSMSSAAAEIHEAWKDAVERAIDAKFARVTKDIETLTELIKTRGTAQRQVDRHAEHLARVETRLAALERAAGTKR